MNFILDDIYSLVIRNKRRIQDYSIESFDNICRENVQLLEDLILFSQTKCEEIKDENIKRAMLYGIKNNLVRAYKYMQTIKPIEEYNANKQSQNNIGYFVEHPDAFYVEKRFLDLKKVYSSIIDFLNWTYSANKIAIKKGINPQPIYEIFEQIKNVCSRLGVRSADESSLWDAFSNPTGDLSIFMNIDVFYDEENLLKDDITIDSLPYFFDCPTFDSVNGLKIYKMFAKEGKAYYNASYVKQQEQIL